MISFNYHPDIFEQYPDLCAAVILAEEISNPPSSPDLAADFQLEQQATLNRIGSTPLSELGALAAWRSAFRLFSVNPTKYRSAPESLLRRLTKKGDIASINTLVDICNLVSIRYALPVASFDTRLLSGRITVHYSDGSERYTPLGMKVVENPEPGEVIFSDKTGLVVARRWCWRQSNQSASRLGTCEAIITIEAQHPQSRSEVEAALRDTLALLKKYSPGIFIAQLLDSMHPSISK